MVKESRRIGLGLCTLVCVVVSLLHVLVVAEECGTVGSGEEKKVLTLHKLHLRRNFRHSTVQCLPQRSRRVKGVTILEMKHHSYCNGPAGKQGSEEIWKLLVSDNTRAESLQYQISNAGSLRTAESSSTGAQIPVSSGAKLQTLNYIVTIELGGSKMTVIVDTGSDLTWVQCKPCMSCYNQEDPLFDPTVSPSYQIIPCNTTTCDSLQYATGVSGVCGTDKPTCNYGLSYGDGSYSNGVLSRDNISLGGTNIKEFVFGCGQNNQGLFGGTSGLMGLGRSQLSLVSQTIPQFGGVFSYCLPTKEFDSSGSLILGSDYSVYQNSTPVIYTRMVSDPQQAPFYFLNLTGMSIGGIALQASGFSNTKILIDSGTVISRLVPSVYKALRDEFVRQFSDYPSAPGFSILDTCFNLTGYNEVDIPTMKFIFESSVGLDVDVDGVLYFVKPDASQVCLALASLTYEDEVGIIGNYQQKNLRIVYDIIGARLGFAEETCGYS